MRRAALLLLLAAVASGERRFKDLKEAEAAAAKAREEALAALEKEDLPIPDVFIEAEMKRSAALHAWYAKEWDGAHAAFEAAFDLYPQAVARAKEELAALPPPVKQAPQLRSASTRAVDAALAWLSRHQDPIGRWDCNGFAKHDPADDKCDGGGHPHYEVGVTALAVLAFLEAGATDKRPEVYRAIQWLRAQPDRDGVLGPANSHSRIYDHAIATLALAKAYGISNDQRYLAQLKPALDYIIQAHNPGRGWRYAPHDGKSDTSVTCWCYRALAAAAEAGIELDLAEPTKGARAWADAMTGADGRIGYNANGSAVARPEGKDRWPADRSCAMTACGTVLRLLVDPNADRKRVLMSLDLCLTRPPSWNPDDGSIDMYYWYYGSLACAADKTRATKWRTALQKALLGHQHAHGSGAREGSFDPIGAWGGEGGRVYSTAICALALLHAG